MGTTEESLPTSNTKLAQPETRLIGGRLAVELPISKLRRDDTGRAPRAFMLVDDLLKLAKQVG